MPQSKALVLALLAALVLAVVGTAVWVSSRRGPDARKAPPIAAPRKPLPEPVEPPPENAALPEVTPAPDPPVKPRRPPALDRLVETDGSRAEARAEEILLRFAQPDEAAFQQAAQELKALGRGITPCLVRRLRDLDAPLAARLRGVLTEMCAPLAAGREQEGLVLAVAPVGPRPEKTGCVTLWVDLRNASAHPVTVRALLCKLLWVAASAPKEIQSPEGPPFGMIFAEEPDYRQLPAGGHLDFVMDADVEGATQSAPEGCALFRFRVRLPRGGDAEGSLLTLASGNLKLTYAGEEPESALEGRLRANAHYHGLHQQLENERWQEFMVVRERRDPDDEDAFVDFMGRWGPHNPKGPEVGQWTRRFAEALPIGRRLRFLERVAAATNYTWRDALLLAGEYRLRARDLGEIGFAARLAGRLHRDGFAVHEDQPLAAFTAWQLYESSDPRVRDAQTAAALARRIAEAGPADPLITFVAATVLEKPDARDEALRQMTDAGQKHRLARRLSTAARASEADRALALRCAQEAADQAGAEAPERALRLDTLALAQAAAGKFAEAAQTAEQAVASSKDPAERANIAWRLALFIGLKSAPQGSFFVPESLREPAVRDALLARLRALRDDRAEERKAVRELLELHFHTDPQVRQAVGFDERGPAPDF